MSVCKDQRTQLADELRAGLGVLAFPAWPDDLDPPCVFVTPPLVVDYIRRGQLFGEFVIALDVFVVVPHGDPAVSLDELEQLVEKAIVHIGGEFTLDSVDAPSPTTVVTEGGAEYLTCVIHVSKPVRFW